MRRARIFAWIAWAGFLAKSAACEPLGPHFEATALAGSTRFDPNLRVAGHPLQDVVYLGGRLTYQARPWWGLDVAGGYGPTQVDTPRGAYVDFYHFSGNLLLTPLALRHGGPFAFLGAGAAQLDGSGLRETRRSVEFGGGLKLWLNDQVGMRLEARQSLNSAGPLSQRVDHVVVATGITVALGARQRDTDGDGVADRLDACPGSPRGATVDAKGCTHDSDQDGVLDGLDRCPATPRGATVDALGCPSDADGDGVLDGLDQCPSTPKGATVDLTGCPRDSDGDGVLDGLDQCPNTPKGAQVDGTGCPLDDDHDGVPNGIDQCPDTPPGLEVNQEGCPVKVIEKESELLDTGMIRLQNVSFVTDKADLQPESYPALDLVGDVLKQWPDLHIEIGGHTDVHGDPHHNLELSAARADSVRSYLMRKFPELKPEQFAVKGYGGSQPLVPNGSELERAENPRVEFVVLNKDALRHSSDRLHQGAPSDSTHR